MAETAKYRADGVFGCGFIGGIFQRQSYWPRKISVHSLPPDSSNDLLKAPSIDNSRRQSSSSVKSACITSTLGNNPSNLSEQPARNSISVYPRTSISHRKAEGRRLSDAARSSTSSSTSSCRRKVSQYADLGDARQPKREPADNCTDLTRMIIDPEKLNESKALVRAATSSNVALSGPLGNLRQTGPGKLLGNKSAGTPVKTVDHLSRNLKQKSSMLNSKNGFGKLGGSVIMGNIVRKNSDDSRQFRGVINKLDPETFKAMGNEAYKQGRFEEALVLYDQAIALDSNNSICHCNKSAALIGLGRLAEAIFECQEAIRIEPSYQRAHHRLAKLYLRYSVEIEDNIVCLLVFFC